jgi:hypothetical protein
MEKLIWQRFRRCPHCDSPQVTHSHYKDFFETVLLLPLLLRPFRCMDCWRRHYNFVFSKRISLPPDQSHVTGR